MYLVITHMPDGVTIGDSGLCFCIYCLSSPIIFLCLLISVTEDRMQGDI